MRALCHQQPYRPIALQLQRERAVKLQRRGQQYRGGHRLTEQSLDRRRVMLQADAVPARGRPNGSRNARTG